MLHSLLGNTLLQYPYKSLRMLVATLLIVTKIDISCCSWSSLTSFPSHHDCRKQIIPFFFFFLNEFIIYFETLIMPALGSIFF